MRSRSLVEHYTFKPYRVCPDCQTKYIADRRTKSRLRLVAVWALVTAALSVLAYIKGPPWSLLPLLSGIGLLVYVGYSLSKVTYVEYR
jgi:hypothetical protein